MQIFLSKNNGSNELWRHKLVFGFEKVYDRAASFHHNLYAKAIFQKARGG